MHETDVVSAEWVDPDRYLGPRMKKITFECGKCGHLWTRSFKAEPKNNPPCPNKSCAHKTELDDLKRQLVNLQAMIESGQPPGHVGANIRVKAIDETAEIVMHDHKLTNLKDNIRQGETMAPPLPAAQQKQADNLFSAAKGGAVPVIGRSASRNTVPAKWLQHIGTRAITGAYRNNSVGPTSVLPAERPPVVREANPGYIKK
jgi:hypothetical protein